MFKTKIRANQGHSIKGIDLGLFPLTPPEKLYHGTSPKNRLSILQAKKFRYLKKLIKKNPT